MRSFVAAMIVAALCAMPVRGEDAAKSAAQPQESYQPGLGEIMALQQMRHSKLWFAGSAGNWPLADYEIGELGEGFDDVGKLVGEEIIKQHVGAPIETLQKAIDGKNKSAFIAVFDKLTAGCNACHHALDHAFIVIQRPTSLPYSNQVFTPQK